MTIVYFIRHCESDSAVRDGVVRPLTEKGMRDRALVTDYLNDKCIHRVLSSPYRRAVDTVSDFAERYGFEIETVFDFRERKSDSDWLRDSDFWPFIERQWSDFTYKLSDGESLKAVQDRNIAALNGVLTRYEGFNVAIGTHGTALSTIVNYYDETYGFHDFMAMVGIMPWVVKICFEGLNCAGIQKIDLFHMDAPKDYEKCRVYTADFGTLKAYRFVVVFAKYRGQWLYCRAKTREGFETAGGHIEQGETPTEAARREFYEETGTTEFEIRPAFDYAVFIPSEFSYGQVFIADIKELSAPPAGFEMAEVRLFDGIPDKMRFPQILPVLYERAVKFGM